MSNSSWPEDLSDYLSQVELLAFVLALERRRNELSEMQVEHLRHAIREVSKHPRVHHRFNDDMIAIWQDLTNRQREMVWLAACGIPEVSPEFNEVLDLIDLRRRDRT